MTYEDKIIEEHNSLEERVGKLLMYIDTDAFDELPDENMDFLEYKLSAMIEYMKVLELEIKNFEPEQ